MRPPPPSSQFVGRPRSSCLKARLTYGFIVDSCGNGSHSKTYREGSDTQRARSTLKGIEGHQRRTGASTVVVASSCKHSEGASRGALCEVSLARSKLARKQQGGKHSGASLSSSAT